MNIYLGKSLAGHDKNHIYVVLSEVDGYMTLANGTTKTVDKPKRKNILHVQVIKKLPANVRRILEDTESLNDDVIAKAVKEYNSYLDACKAQDN